MRASWDQTNMGMNFSGKFGDASMIWYPFAGLLDMWSGQLINVGSDGSYVSSTPYLNNRVVRLVVYYHPHSGQPCAVGPSGSTEYANGSSVRCCKE